MQTLPGSGGGPQERLESGVGSGAAEVCPKHWESAAGWGADASEPCLTAPGKKRVRRMNCKWRRPPKRPPGPRLLPHREISTSLCQGTLVPWLFLHWVLS